MRKRYLIFLLPLLFARPARATETEALELVAQKIADRIVEKPKPFADHLTPEFLKAVPLERLESLFRSMHAENGKVERVTLKSSTSSTAGVFTFHYHSTDMRVTLGITPAEPHRIASLWFASPVPRLKTLDEVTARLARLPGTVSYQLERLDDGVILQSHNPDQPLAIGSTFKLYVLATLFKQKVPWDKVVTLDDRFKSYPSGEMQKWPVGSPVTVHTMALKMISISDNTAADHLLMLAGRHSVEAELPELGMKSPERDVPFLTTQEMMRVKADPEVEKNYLAAEGLARQAILDSLGSSTKPTDDEIDRAFGEPNAIDRIEWFASAADLCRLMNWYDRQDDKTLLGILSLNPGIASRPKKLSYLGFKGGSETGVLNLTWLVRAENGKHYAVSVGWNNPEKEVDTPELVGLMEAALELVGEER